MDRRPESSTRLRLDQKRNRGNGCWPLVGATDSTSHRGGAREMVRLEPVNIVERYRRGHGPPQSTLWGARVSIGCRYMRQLAAHGF